MVRGVLFDLDDTLIDSGPAFQHGCRAALLLICGRFPALDFREVEREWWSTLREMMVEMPADGSMQEVRERRFPRLLTRLGIVDEELAAAADRRLGEEQLSVLQPFDDVTVLQRLSDTYALGVITNGAADAHWDSQITKAQHTGLYEPFQCFLVSDKEQARKPRPEMFCRACDRLGLAVEECVYVGDSPANDIAGAQGAGMPAVWLNRGGKSHPFEVDPWRTIRSLWELPSILNHDGR